ncbi:MAG: hypothetical protein KDA24_22850 [Deltaproteobacteria bacterium]|nr:hypothetical protein [Deltaproteobacteria bacterium]
MSFDDISRLTDRARTKMIERALSADQLPRSTERLLKREAGPMGGSTPKVELISRDAAVRLAGSEDFRSEIVRQAVAMSVLDGENGLGRSEEVAEDDGGAEEGSKKDAPTAMAGIFEQWFTEMQGQGLNKAEIEEALISRIRAVRRGILGAAEERRLRRK